jgi:hypothetical protein
MHLPIPFGEANHLGTLVTLDCHSVKKQVLNHPETFLAVGVFQAHYIIKQAIYLF